MPPATIFFPGRWAPGLRENFLLVPQSFLHLAWPRLHGCAHLPPRLRVAAPTHAGHQSLNLRGSVCSVQALGEPDGHEDGAGGSIGAGRPMQTFFKHFNPTEVLGERHSCPLDVAGKFHPPEFYQVQRLCKVHTRGSGYLSPGGWRFPSWPLTSVLDALRPTSQAPALDRT